MLAHQAGRDGLIVLMNVAAVAASPRHALWLGEHLARLRVGQQLLITLFMLLLDLRQAAPAASRYIDRAIRRKMEACIMPDGVHLTAEGNRIVAETVFDAVEEVMK